jgi:nitroimidazol reductase NimA-like FMN-containing flavoprotein (pyridoxamine 5'-phosphate oxidase superfamily)
MDTEDAEPLDVLTSAEALALLAAEEVGRLVYTRRALPVVTPVNYALRDGALWIWTASASSMARAVRGAVVAFEADSLDRASRTGWTVTVLGVAELVVEPAELERARALGPEPWVPGRKEHLIRVPLKIIYGRRIGPAPGTRAESADESARIGHGGPLARAEQ